MSDIDDEEGAFGRPRTIKGDRSDSVCSAMLAENQMSWQQEIREAVGLAIYRCNPRATKAVRAVRFSDIRGYVSITGTRRRRLEDSRLDTEGGAVWNDFDLFHMLKSYDGG